MPQWQIFDTLMNLVSGLGTSKDKGVHHQYVITELTKDVLEAMYRSDWVARKITDAPAKDATRSWRQWQADNHDIEAIEEVERRLKIQAKTFRALQLARLYGGSALILGVGHAGEASRELMPESVTKDSLRFVHAVSRHELSSMEGLETDLESPYFGEPRMYVRQISGGDMLRIHPSRVIRFDGEPLPDPAMSSEGWGESVLQAVYDAVKSAGVVSQGIAAMVEEAKVDVIQIPDLTAQLSTEAGTTKLVRRFSLTNQNKSIINALLLDKEDTWNRQTTSFGTLPDVMRVYLLMAAGAADIPATRLLGQSPSGLSATGESDIRNYYDRIKADQVNHLTPAMARLDEVLVRSALGVDDEDIFYEWNPLWQMTEAEKAEVAHKKAQTFQVDVNTMLIPTDALAKARQNQLIEDGTYPGLETALEESDGEVFDPRMEAQLEQQMQLGEREHEQGLEQAEVRERGRQEQRGGQSSASSIERMRKKNKRVADAVAVMELMDAEDAWDPSKHPRDNKGQWASVAGAKDVDIGRVKTSQARSETNKTQVEHYRQMLRGKNRVMPLEVVHNLEEDDYRLLDGHHRLYAARREGLDKVRVRVAHKSKTTKEANSYIRAVRFGDATAVEDAEPRTLYVYRDLVNRDELRAWAREQGFASVIEDLHVTLVYCKYPVDWMRAGDAGSWSQREDGTLRVPPGGVRLVETLGPRGAVCLLFTSSSLSWRREEIMRGTGASSEHSEYQPHVTITYRRGDVDPALIEPYQGELVFGPETFEEIRQDFEPGEENVLDADTIGAAELPL